MSFLQPLIIRCFKMMLRKNAFGEIPQLVRQKGSLNIDISFDNPLSRSQSFEEVSSTQNWLAFVGQAAQFRPKCCKSGQHI